MDFSLTSEQRQIQLEARAFAAEIDAERRFPLDIVSQLADRGFLAGPLPAEYGGRGMDYISFALVYEEIGRACSSIRGFLAVHVGLVSMCICEWGNAEQKQSFLPRLARAELIGAY